MNVRNAVVCIIMERIRFKAHLVELLSNLGRVSPKLSQLGRHLTDHQLGNKLNSSFRFINVIHVNSDLSQLTDDHAFSLAELPLVRFEINCCHANTNRW